jgi:hypothetical protein
LDENQKFRNWLRKQLQEYGLTPDELSERLDWRLSAPTIERLLNGRLLWSAIPGEDKLDVTPELEAILGPLPSQQESRIPENANFRPATLEQQINEEYLSELLKDIAKDIQDVRAGEALQRPDELRQDMPLFDDLVEYDAIFEVCNRCRAPMKDSRGECIQCGRVSDGSQ